MTSSLYNELRLSKEVCDGVLTTTDGTTFNVHRLVMSAFSPYFRAYFTNCLNNGNSEIKEMMIKDVPASIVSNIIEFAYTGNCPTTRDNVHALMVASDLLSCLPIVNHCCSFIANNLTPGNCLHNWRFAKAYNNRGLEVKVWMYVCQEAERVLRSQAFLKLTVEEVKQVLSADELNVMQEETVFDAIVKWTCVDPDRRRRHLTDLLPCVRFGLVSNEYYKEVIKKSEYHTKESLDLLSVVDVVIENTEESSHFRYRYFQSRVPNEVIFVIGGWSEGSPTDLVETYDKRSDLWCITNIQVQRIRAYHGAVVLDQKIFVLGGFDGGQYFNTLHMFDPVTYQWTEKGCMHEKRCYVSACEYGGEIYAIGGCNGNARLNSVEKYNPALNQWTLVAPMLEKRSDANAAVYKGRIYVAGGFNGHEVLSSVEMYDVASDHWEFVNCLGTPRSGFSMITHGHYIYAIGGFDGTDRLNSVMRYNTNTKHWEYVADMLVERSNMASVVVDNGILVMGGFDGQSTIPHSEMYNIEKGVWNESADMNINRSAFAAVICRGLPNARSYTYQGVPGNTSAPDPEALEGDGLRVSKL